jgi:hypothetical protein
MTASRDLKRKTGRTDLTARANGLAVRHHRQRLAAPPNKASHQ